MQPTKLALTAIIFLLSPIVLIHSSGQENEDSTRQLRVRVRLAEVTVSAKSGDGRHVTDLLPGEFTLTAGKRKREIRVFRPVFTALERFGALKPLGVEYRPIEEAVEYPPRYYLLLFHKLQYEFGFFQRAKAAAIEFVRERMLPGDHVAVAAFDKRIDFQLDFTSDRVAVLNALEGLELKHRNIEMVDGFYSYLQELAHRAARMPHKVSVILIAAGMQGIGGPAKYSVYDQAIKALQAADVRVFGIDAVGLDFRDPGASIARLPIKLGALVKQSFNLGLYTEPTGGRFFRYNNNLLDLFEQVDYEMSAYYVLGFYLDEDDGEGPFSIRIVCSRPGVSLSYKKRVNRLVKPEDERRP